MGWVIRSTTVNVPSIQNVILCVPSRLGSTSKSGTGTKMPAGCPVPPERDDIIIREIGEIGVSGLPSFSDANK